MSETGAERRLPRLNGMPAVGENGPQRRHYNLPLSAKSRLAVLLEVVLIVRARTSALQECLKVKVFVLSWTTSRPLERDGTDASHDRRADGGDSESDGSQNNHSQAKESLGDHHLPWRHRYGDACVMPHLSLAQ